MNRFRVRDNIPANKEPTTDAAIDDPFILRTIGNLQREISAQNYDIRSTLWKYSLLVEEQRKAVAAWREAVMSGTEIALPWYANRARLHKRFGAARLGDIERELLLMHIDDCWAEHLANDADIRESAHLTTTTTAIGGLDPYLSYRMRIAKAFALLQPRTIDRTLERLQREDFEAFATHSGRPSGTWTYLVNDQFLDGDNNPMRDHVSQGTEVYAILLAWPILLLVAICRKLTSFWRRK